MYTSSLVIGRLLVVYNDWPGRNAANRRETSTAPALREQQPSSTINKNKEAVRMLGSRLQTIVSPKGTLHNGISAS